MSGLVKLRRPGEAHDPRAAEAPLVASVADEAPAVGARLAYIETYGCQMNVADTELVSGLLKGAGFARTDNPAAADLILLNTCAVRDNAEERVFARVQNLAPLKRKRPGVVLGVTGCMAEHLKDRIAERAPAVDLIVGPDAYRRLVEHVEAAASGGKVADTKLDRHERYDGLDPLVEGGVIGHVTIQRGCDKFCTFCVVPYTRGRERSTPPREILRQVRAVVTAGAREVQLLGQTVNSYRYEDVGFGQLLRTVAEVPGLARVRFTSPYPLDFTPEVIAAMAETPSVCKHVHLPLQTGSDAVLLRMERGYDYATYRTLVRDLRAAMPSIAITTDLMVGFCDETEAEFGELVAAMEELRFDGAFTFAYSEREGTHAARKMPDTIPEDVKRRRLDQVIAVQRRIADEINQAQIGKREQILIESPSKRDPQQMFGRTDAFRSVIVPAGPGIEPGALVDVLIERATSATLFARPITPAA